jgi:stage IV sporulation protein FB
MENFTDPLADRKEEDLAAKAGAVVYPPKFQRPEQSYNVWLRSITSLALYLALGFYVFKQWEILLLITAIVMIHELGHFFAMKYYRYSDLGIFFIPLLGAYVSGTKREISQKQSAVILLAGPLPGILIGMVFYWLDQQGSGRYFFEIPFEKIGLLFIVLNVINLLPVYPLDGGQLLNRVFLDEESIWSKAFIFISVGLLGWFAISKYLSTGNAFYFVFLLFPLMMLFRLAGEKKLGGIEKRIEAEGIHLDIDYKDLPDEDYWKIRDILVEEHPAFRDVHPSPPYEYDVKEEKIMAAIQNLLHRHLVQDMSLAGKILIALVWIAAFAAPWWLGMYDSFIGSFIPR